MTSHSSKQKDVNEEVCQMAAPNPRELGNHYAKHEADGLTYLNPNVNKELKCGYQCNTQTTDPDYAELYN